MRRLILSSAALALMLGAAGQAGAGLLVDLEDPPGGTDTPFTLPFVAGSDSTTITFAGYQISSSLDATNIDLFLTGGGPNLLGGTWNFTPAPFGSFASPFDDGDREFFLPLQFEGSSRTRSTRSRRQSPRFPVNRTRSVFCSRTGPTLRLPADSSYRPWTPRMPDQPSPSHPPSSCRRSSVAYAAWCGPASGWNGQGRRETSVDGQP